ncbi:MAG: Fe-S cluster assembly protein NifU [Deltaproteobacteria bacterium]|nr:Fe-S cluster assembly protein NifU [Deltaproteobacteria bacterium]
MWDYNDKVKDHFRNPRNVGYIKDADGVGLVGSMACGDALKLMFKLDGEQRIEDVKFQTFGCASAIASSSALTELIKGKSLDEAARVSNKEIAEYLGGLPEQKMHCSVLGRDALLAAIDNYRKKSRGEQPEEVQVASDVVCACFGVTRQEIERTVRENKLSTVEEVTNYTKAGGGCGGCVPQIEELLTEINASPPPVREAQPKAAKKRLTTIQKIQLIQETIDREIRPQLQKDGGDIELVDLDGDMVVVSMRGTCSHCKVASFTLKFVVENKLREFVSDSLRVVEASSAEAGDEA